MLGNAPSWPIKLCVYSAASLFRSLHIHTSAILLRNCAVIEIYCIKFSNTILNEKTLGFWPKVYSVSISSLSRLIV